MKVVMEGGCAVIVLTLQGGEELKGAMGYLLDELDDQREYEQPEWGDLVKRLYDELKVIERK